MKLPLTWFARTLNKMPIPKDLRLTWQAYLFDAIFRKEIKDLKASKDKDREELRSLEFEQQSEISMIYEELDAHHTRKLIRQARRLRVSVPSHFNEDGSPSEYWEQGDNLRLWYLSDKGLLQIRKAIREELEWVYKKREHYISWMTVMTGIIGFLIGLMVK